MGSLSPTVPSVACVSHHPFIFPLQAAANHPDATVARPGERARKSSVRTGPRNRVLMFGKIRELALYRAEVLRSNGFNVTIPASKADAIAAIRRGGFDVAVLTYTLSNDTVEELTELLRQHWPDSRLVTISEMKYPDPKINPDANVLADEGPKALIKALRATLKQG